MGTSNNNNPKVLRVGSVTFNRCDADENSPWENKTLGWIPNATTKRARFMNSILPLYYKSMHPFCKNAREFVKRFHNEGRHEYDTEGAVERLEKRTDNIMNPKNAAAAGKYFCEDYVLTQADIPTFENNLKMVQDIQISIQKLEKDVKEQLCTHYTKGGKLISGHVYPKSFDEKIIGKLTKVRERVLQIEGSLLEKLEKTKNMFKLYKLRNAKSKKRSKKENRRKSKKRKVSRNAINMQKVREFISNASSSVEVIQSENLNLEALAMISLSQVKYVHLMFEDGQLSDDSVQLISEYVKNFPSKENHHSDPDSDGVDDDNDDEDDDDSDDDGDDDSDDEVDDDSDDEVDDDSNSDVDNGNKTNDDSNNDVNVDD